MICEANLIDGLTDQEVQGLFDAARNADYDEIAGQLRNMAASMRGKRKALGGQLSELKSQVTKLRRRLTKVNAVDFFGAKGRMVVEGLLSEIERGLTGAELPDHPEQPAKEQDGRKLLGKTWVTRSGVHVDRMAYASADSPFRRSRGRIQIRNSEGLSARTG